MPIRPENRNRYPENWPEIRRQIRARAGARCECEGECGAIHGAGEEAGPSTPSERCTHENGRAIVPPGKTYADAYPCVLTVAHLDHQPENCEHRNLKAMCQPCHLRYDAPRKRAERLAKKAAGTAPLF